MKNKLRNIILILGVVSIIAVIYQRQDLAKQEVVPQQFKLLMPDLRNQFNEISKITLQNRDDIVTLSKQENGKWVVVEQNNYAVNMQELRKMLLYLSQSELRDKKTSDPTRFNRLGLDELIGKNIRIFAGEKLLYDVILGSMSSDLSATYVRIKGDNQTYKASGELQFHAAPDNWLDFNFISIDKNLVQKIDYKFNGKKSYQYVRQNPNKMMQLLPAPDAKLLSQKPTSIDPTTYFERLAFTGVTTAKNANIKGDITTMTTFDGLQIELEFYEIEFMPWVKITANIDMDTRNNFAKNHLKTLPEVETEAANINEITKNWLYQLGQFQQQNLSRSYLDLTEIKSN